MDGHLYCRVNMLRIDRTHVENACSGRAKGVLVDGGANGGLAGSDMTVLETTFDCIDVTGIGGFTKQNVPIVTGASYIKTTTGPIIGVFHQYAQFQGQKSIHSANQLRHMGNHVGDTPRLYGGTQLVQTSCGQIIPLSI